MLVTSPSLLPAAAVICFLLVHFFVIAVCIFACLFIVITYCLLLCH